MSNSNSPGPPRAENPSPSEAVTPDQASPTCQSCAGCGRPIARVACVASDYISRVRFRVLACDHCGLLQTAIDPSVDLGAFYTDYYGERQGRFEPVINRLRRRRLTRAVRRISPGTLLDVGCGRGGFLAALRAAGWTVSGLERPGSGYQSAWSRAELDVRTGAWDEAAYTPGAFDVVTFWHVFEHLPSPHGALDKARKVLKDDGVLVIAVPNIAGFQARMFKRDWFHLDVPRHLFHFSLDTLGGLLREHRFSVLTVNHYSVEYDAFGAIQSGLNLVCGTPNLLFDLLMGRTTIRTIARRGHPRELADLGLTAVLSIPLFFLAVPLGWIASWMGRGATIEVYAKKESGPATYG